MFKNEMHGIDSTGYSTEYQSHYYDKRVREFGLKKEKDIHEINHNYRIKITDNSII